eukprot:gene21909-28951_t
MRGNVGDVLVGVFVATPYSAMIAMIVWSFLLLALVSLMLVLVLVVVCHVSGSAQALCLMALSQPATFFVPLQIAMILWSYLATYVIAVCGHLEHLSVQLHAAQTLRAQAVQFFQHQHAASACTDSEQAAQGRRLQSDLVQLLHHLPAGAPMQLQRQLCLAVVPSVLHMVNQFAELQAGLVGALPPNVCMMLLEMVADEALTLDEFGTGCNIEGRAGAAMAIRASLRSHANSTHEAACEAVLHVIDYCPDGWVDALGHPVLQLSHTVEQAAQLGDGAVAERVCSIIAAFAGLSSKQGPLCLDEGRGAEVQQCLLKLALMPALNTDGDPPCWPAIQAWSTAAEGVCGSVNDTDTEAEGDDLVIDRGREQASSFYLASDHPHLKHHGPAHGASPTTIEVYEELLRGVLQNLTSVACVSLQASPTTIRVHADLLRGVLQNLTSVACVSLQASPTTIGAYEELLRGVLQDLTSVACVSLQASPTTIRVYEELLRGVLQNLTLWLLPPVLSRPEQSSPGAYPASGLDQAPSVPPGSQQQYKGGCAHALRHAPLAGFSQGFMQILDESFSTICDVIGTSRYYELVAAFVQEDATLHGAAPLYFELVAAFVLDDATIHGATPLSIQRVIPFLYAVAAAGPDWYFDLVATFVQEDTTIHGAASLSIQRVIPFLYAVAAAGPRRCQAIFSHPSYSPLSINGIGISSPGGQQAKPNSAPHQPACQPSSVSVSSTTPQPPRMLHPFTMTLCKAVDAVQGGSITQQEPQGGSATQHAAQKTTIAPSLSAT